MSVAGMVRQGRGAYQSTWRSCRPARGPNRSSPHVEGRPIGKDGERERHQSVVDQAALRLLPVMSFSPSERWQDRLHEAFKEGHGEGRVAAGGTLEHALGDERVAHRATVVTLHLRISAMSPERCGPCPSSAIARM